MAVIKHHEADRFIAAPPNQTSLYLLFGTDVGLISERTSRLLAQILDDKNDPMACLRLNGDDIAADPLRLLDEANAVTMFGASQVILIRLGTKPIHEAVEDLLNGPPPVNRVIIEAGALRKDHQLRKLCEKSPLSAAIECYPDQPKDLAVLIDAQLKKEGLGIDRDAKDTLVTLLGGDRLSTRNEVEKLALFAHGAGNITVEHINAVVADASALALDDAIDAAFLGKFEDIDETAARAFSTHNTVEVLIASALRHAMQLHATCCMAEQGEKQEIAIGKCFGFRIHFTRKPKIIQQVTQWNADKALRAVGTLADTNLKARQNQAMAESATLRALWSIAFAARSSRNAKR